MPHYRISDTGRILPSGLDNELPRLPMRLAGAAFLVMAAIGWISLLSWSFGDPSVNRAVDGAPQNFLGATGASLADTLFQILGLASITLFLPPAAWGLALVSGEAITNARNRLIMWTLSLILVSSMLSILPTPQNWLLPHGMGGLIGDIGNPVFLITAGLFNEQFAKGIGIAASGLLGLVTLLRASGIGAREGRMLFQSRSSISAGAIGFAGGFIGYLFYRVSSVFRGLAGLIARRKARLSEAPSPYWQEENNPHFDPRFDRSDDSDDYPEEEIPQPAPSSTRIHRAASNEKRVEPYFEGHRMIPVHSVNYTPTAAPIIHAKTHSQADRIVLSSPQYPAVPQTPYPQQPQPQMPPQNYQQPQNYNQQWPVQYYGEHIQPPQHQHQPPASAPSPYQPMPQQAQPPYHQPAPMPNAVPYPQQHQSTQHQPQEQTAYANENYRNGAYVPPTYALQGAAAQQTNPAPVIRSSNVAVPTQQPMPDRFAPSSAIRGQASASGLNTGEFMLPPLDLLASPPPHQNDPELSDSALGRRAELLESVLEDFRVKGQINGVHPGPVITLYEFEPARGTKSSRVIGLADDIARSMSAVSARVAVIPGRDAMGIELPNRNREVVYLRELLESKEFIQGKGRLQLALGKTIGGDPVIVDLARMPHLLIAGTTGSGKSVAINTMILSLLYRLPPEECRFIMIDPKMLELSVYDGIPHLLTPVVTDPHKAIKALKWTVNEMNVRYERMCKLGVRNIMGFNQKVARAARKGEPLMRPVQTGVDEGTGNATYERENFDATPMPYIVVVIDEMADLMMVAGKDIEFAVQRLSQMARAAGIHLIMATQRPSVDVITGTIKANFPSRISFQVTSKIDSRTILGEQGAEQLLGAGDMLTMAAGGRIMRAHGPFVSDDEVETIVNSLREQGEPEYMVGLVDDTADADAGQNSAVVETGSNDDVYNQAVEIVLRDRRPTTSYLQRRLSIGYNRAASMIEQMEQDGIISEPNRTGKREVLMGEAS